MSAHLKLNADVYNKTIRHIQMFSKELNKKKTDTILNTVNLSYPYNFILFLIKLVNV